LWILWNKRFREKRSLRQSWLSVQIKAKMNTLIIKLGATGDVVRTTPLLRRLTGGVTWITAAKNLPLLQGLEREIRAISWEQRQLVSGTEYDLVINLEDDPETSAFAQTIGSGRRFGAYLDSQGVIRYTGDSKGWFDLSLISTFGRKQADVLKLKNRRTYQDLIFEGLGFPFAGESYLMPEPVQTGLAGDVAIAPEAGAVWPMKQWAYYDPLRQELEAKGLIVNVLQKRPTLLEHLCDVQNHRCLVSGDSLPMHLALGTGTRCVTLFNCTSPWEICEYGLQRKIISPRLEEFFYQRGFNERATTAIGLEEVFNAVMGQLEDGKQRTEGRGQMSEVGRQRTEGRPGN
jgi:lipopolysaccharide heptosyltransferase II